MFCMSQNTYKLTLCVCERALMGTEPLLRVIQCSCIHRVVQRSCAHTSMCVAFDQGDTVLVYTKSHPVLLFTHRCVAFDTGWYSTFVCTESHPKRHILWYTDRCVACEKGWCSIFVYTYSLFLYTRIHYVCIHRVIEYSHVYTQVFL